MRSRHTLNCSPLRAGDGGRLHAQCLLSGLPSAVAARTADPAWSVTRGDGRGLVGEEDAVPYVAAPSDRAERGRAVEATVDLGRLVAAPLPFDFGEVRAAVRSCQCVAHGASWKTSPRVWRTPERTTDTPCRTGAADQPRADRMGRSLVVNR